MDVVFHRLIKKDLRSALAYYDSEGGQALGDRFFEDVEATVSRIRANPDRYHFVSEGLRRAQLTTVPYHFLYEISSTNHPRAHSTFWFCVMISGILVLV